MSNKKLDRGILNISIFIVVITLLLLIVSLFLVRKLVLEDIESHNLSLLDLTYDQISYNVEKPFTQIEKVDDLIEKYGIESDVVQDYIESFADNFEHIDQIMIVNNQAKIVNITHNNQNSLGIDVSYESYYINRKFKQWYWSDVYMSSLSGKNVIAASNDKIDYMLVVELNLEELPLTLQYKDYFDEVISLSVLDEFGTYIINNNIDLVTGRYRYEYFDTLKSSSTSFYENKDTFFLSKLNPLMRWYIILELDMDIIHQKLNNMTLYILLGWFVFSVVLFKMIKTYFKKVSIGLYVLKDHTLKVLNQNYDFDVEPVHFHEFEELDNNFRHMAKTIDARTREIIEMNENLEEKIRERTILLEESNCSLEEEIQERELVEEEIRIINNNLDSKVKERTLQLERLNEDLRISIKKAEEASEAKSKFLAVMSHEMRTPLNGIIGFASLLQTNTDPIQNSENIEMILSSSQVLLSLINDVLDIAKYEAGEMQFENTCFNLQHIIRDVLKPMGSMIKGKGLGFRVEGFELLDLEVIGDPIKIRQVFTNILNNALKFTDDGSIDIYFRTEIKDQLKLYVTIEDTGIGMSKNEMRTIFQPFKQADDTIHRMYGGTGLGLSICKEIVERMKGHIQYESELNVGTKCFFEFTLELKPENENVFIDSGIHILNETKVDRVLFVEDHIVNQTLMTKFFKKYNVNYDLAENGIEAVELCKKNNYDIILMDCQMPIMDGFEATKVIRTFVPASLPIIAMTAYTSEENRIKCLKAGMTDYVPKPVDLTKLSNLLGVEYQYLADVSKIEINDDIDFVKIYASELSKKIGFDSETCIDLIETFKSQVIKALTEITNNRIANDYEAIERLLHQIKGASATVRIDTIYEKAKEAEAMMHAKLYDQAFVVIDHIKMEGLLNTSR